MNRHNLVAVYSSRQDAERAYEELTRFGVTAEDMRLSPLGELGGAAAQPAEDWSQDRHHGFWDWLFGNDVPEHDRSWYATNLREGRTALSVLLRDDAERDRVADILERFSPIDIGDGSTMGLQTAQPGPGIGTAPSFERGTAGSAEMRDRVVEPLKEGEQVIPVVKEELAVGKRVAERRYRIRTYVIETPVEEQVRLHDERVIIERRPASSAAAAGDPEALREREFEVVERREEPVIEKRARPVEEVVVRREANDRVETVRDTVRETKVDVDKGSVERQTEGELPASRRP